MPDKLYNVENAVWARSLLLAWFEKQARIFPWRYDNNPYHVLMAEMMLRRTQARQVVEVYRRFLVDYPDMVSLTTAPGEQIKEILRPLGLAWRAANFEHLARVIIERYKGEVPRERQALIQLPGVGPYVADAVRTFAFGEDAALIDTNTVRVAARFFGFDYDQESRRRPAVAEAVRQMVEREQAAMSNYALLDFAAIVCRARNPLHEQCPLAERCAFYNLSNSKHQD